MDDNLSMMKMQLERDRCCMQLSRCTCTISANIIVHCKRLQEYVKSIIKDDKNVLKPEAILQKNHVDSEWCIQNIIDHINCSAGPSHCEFQDNLWIN